MILVLFMANVREKKMDNELEETLKKIYNLLDESTKNEVSIDSSKFEKETVDYLKKKHLIEVLDASTFDGWEYMIRPTFEGKKYFEEKEITEREKRKQQTKESVRFWLPIVISIISLVVSIFK